jgi:hypothetical protein
LAGEAAERLQRIAALFGVEADAARAASAANVERIRTAKAS